MSKNKQKSRLSPHISHLTFLFIFLASCNSDKTPYDASGSFEAVETIISAEATGTLKRFDVEEGETLTAGQFVGYVDSIQLYLKKRQTEAQIRSLIGKKANIPIQLAALKTQLAQAERDQNRVANLFRDQSATQKQLDDANSAVAVVKKQIDAQNSSLDITNAGISNDVFPLEAQIEQLNDQLEKCKIINPINGTVLTKYAEVDEMTASGKALYKIADLSTIILRVYITNNQLSQVKINQKVKVLTDDGNGGYKQTEGIITWINDKAEFTPKTIQTKDERANLVYAVKVNVKNDGSYKIGMYGEVKF